MRSYDKRLPDVYSDRAMCTKLEFLTLKTELDYIHKMLDGANRAYESLIYDLLDGEEISIEGKKYTLSEVETCEESR